MHGSVWIVFMLTLPRTRRQRWSLVVFVLLGAVLQGWPTSVPPAWWQRGWPRQRVDSVAAAELLSQLAVVLMPKTPIEELVRSFPSPEGWSGNYLEPDLVAFGVLKDPDAALFVEYDGDVDHAKRKSKTKDQKNQALLDYGPPGSCVLRINHRHSSPLKDQVLEIRVCPWQPRNTSSLQSALSDTLTQTFRALGQVLSPKAAKRLGRQANRSFVRLSAKAEKFVQRETASSHGNTTEEITWFLEAQGFNQEEIKLMEARSSLSGKSIQRTLQPAIQRLFDIGLSHAQVAHAIFRFPRLLGSSIKNLRPTVQWLRDMGLTPAQVVKVVTSFPQVLAMSVQENLKPTVQWLLDIGLSTDLLTKVIASHPWALGFGVERNLKPARQWLLDIGLSKEEVVNVVANFPLILGLRIEENLKPKQALLASALSSSEVAALIGQYPRILSFSYQRLAQRLRVLSTGPKLEGMTLASALSLTEAKFEQRFQTSCDEL